MGADLILAYLVLRKDKQPDWENAKRFVSELVAVPEGLRDSFNEEECDDPIQTCKDALVNALDNLAMAMRDGARSMSVFEFKDWKICLIGGTSWGDDPSELFTHVNLLDSAGAVLEAAGFEEEEA